MRSRWSFALLLCASMFGCPKPEPVQPQPQPAVITDTNECGPACAVLMEKGCEEGMPVEVSEPGGKTRLASCSEVCHNTQDNGVWLNPVCVQKITTCDQVESCAVLTPSKK